MKNDITVIGLGSLGSLLCDSLTNLQEVKRLVLVDYENVEEKNLKLSLYGPNDVGKLKVKAMEDIIKNKNKNIEVITINKKFVESETEIPKTSLVIDCRDFTYDRNGFIDTRLSISSGYFLVDCRRFVSYKNAYTGSYTPSISKKQIANSAEFAVYLLVNGLLENLIKEQKLYAVSLDVLESFLKSSLVSKKQTSDMIIDMPPNFEKFTNIMDCFNTIISLNNESDVTVSVGDINKPLCKQVIKKGSFNSIHDVVSKFSELTLSDDRNYLVFIKSQSNSIQLIAEHAAA